MTMLVYFATIGPIGFATTEESIPSTAGDQRENSDLRLCRVCRTPPALCPSVTATNSQTDGSR